MKKAVFGLVAGETALAVCSTAVPLKTESDGAYAKEQIQLGANAQGFLEFLDVAAGDFFVSTGIAWTASYSKQGGALMEGVSVSGGDVVNVVLSP